MTVTIKDVAALAGVSPMTVSRVVNGSPRVRADTRQRVLDAVAELGYVPNGLARGLSRQKTGTIGLVVPDIVDPFFTLVLRGSRTSRGGRVTGSSSATRTATSSRSQTISTI
jgi:LacI family transcriptional regulator